MIHSRGRERKGRGGEGRGGEWRGGGGEGIGQRENLGSDAISMKSSMMIPQGASSWNGPSELSQVGVRRPRRISQWNQLLTE